MRRRRGSFFKRSLWNSGFVKVGIGTKTEFPVCQIVKRALRKVPWAPSEVRRREIHRPLERNPDCLLVRRGSQNARGPRWGILDNKFVACMTISRLFGGSRLSECRNSFADGSSGSEWGSPSRDPPWGARGKRPMFRSTAGRSSGPLELPPRLDNKFVACIRPIRETQEGFFF